MDNNLSRIIYEVSNNIQWGAGAYGTPPYDFESFSKSTESPYDLAINFLKYYERPLVLDYTRGNQALQWYEFLGGVIPPKPIYTKKKNFPWFIYAKKFRKQTK